MEMKENSQMCLILGRQSLKMTEVFVDMKRDIMTLRVEDEKMESTFNKSMEALVMEEVHQMDTLEKDLSSLKALNEVRDPFDIVLSRNKQERGGEVCNLKKVVNKVSIYHLKEANFKVFEVPLEKESTKLPPTCKEKMEFASKKTNRTPLMTKWTT